MALVFDPLSGRYVEESQVQKTPEQLRQEQIQQLQSQLYGGQLSNAQIQQAMSQGLLTLNDLTASNDYQRNQLQLSKDQWALDQQRGFDSSGKPIAAPFETMIDKETGLLKDPLLLKSNVNQGALEMMREEAGREGPSKWRTLAESAARDQMARQSAGQLQQAKSQLAMTGGLRGGSAERLAQNSMLNNLQGMQATSNQFAMQDEKNRQAMIPQLAGQELAYAGYGRDTDKYNIDKTLAETLQKRGYDINKYNEAMRAWGAERTAAATPSGGGGGGKK